MKRFKNILVYVPHSIVNENILKWVSMIAQEAESENIDVVTSVQGYDELISDTDWEKFAEHARAEWTASTPLKELNANVNYELHRRSGLQMMLSYMSSGTYDLVVLPREHSQALSFVERVCRKSTSGVLIVPKDCSPELSSIMLSLDFGNISELAIEWTEAFASMAPRKPELKALHVVQIPLQSRAFPAMDVEDFRAQLYDISKAQMKKFLKAHAKDAKAWKPVFEDHTLPSFKVLEVAERAKTDLLVIGSHGKGAISSALLGGQSIDIIRDCEIPLLVVKRKNETLGFIRRLLGMD